MAGEKNKKDNIINFNNINMNIIAAYNTMTAKEFVDWALLNKYPYFIVIEGNRERGWVYPKKGNKQYKFNYTIK